MRTTINMDIFHSGSVISFLANFKTESVSLHMPGDRKWIVSGRVLKVTSGNTPGQEERLLTDFGENPQISSTQSQAESLVN